MKTIGFLGAVILLSASSAAFGQAIERPATKAEIENLAVGHTMNRRMRYMTNGRYLHGGKFPGVYTISDGRICVHFDNRKNRCDRITTDNGTKFWIITSAGKKSTYKRRK
jgi:hypothetical protein